MITGLERLMRLLDEYEQCIENAGDQGEDLSDRRFDERDVIERQLLLAPIESIADVVTKLNYLARIAEDGERCDGADVSALRGLAAWMEAHFGAAAPGQASEEPSRRLSGGSGPPP